MDVTIQLDGRTYEWQWDADTEWVWRDKDGRIPPESKIQRLDAALYDGPIMTFAADLSTSDRISLIRALDEREAPQRVTTLVRAARQSKTTDPSSLPPPPDYAWRDPFSLTRPPYRFSRDASTMPSTIVVTGSGVFGPSAALVAEALRHLGLSVSDPSNDADGLLIGRFEWDAGIINETIDRRSGRHLRVYSHELFEHHVLGIDPFGKTRDSWSLRDRCTRDHSGIHYLRRGWPKWPSTIVGDAKGLKAGRIDREPASPLAILGYTCSEGGPDDLARQRILTRAFRDRLPAGTATKYVMSWGVPGGPERLKGIANLLADRCRDEKRAVNHGVRSSSDAIGKWERDLSWLRQTFWHGSLKFAWPETQVPH